MHPSRGHWVASASQTSAHPATEQVFVVAFIVTLLAFSVAGLSEVGRRVEKRTGPDTVQPTRRTTPAAMIFQGLALYMNQPGSRARVRNVCLSIGSLGLVACIVAVVVGAHNARRSAQRSPAFFVVNDTGKAATVTDCGGTVSISCYAKDRLQLGPAARGRLPFSPSGTPLTDIAEISGVWKRDRCILIPPPAIHLPNTTTPSSLITPLSAASADQCAPYDRHSGL